MAVIHAIRSQLSHVVSYLARGPGVLVVVQSKTNTDLLEYLAKPQVLDRAGFKALLIPPVLESGLAANQGFTRHATSL